MTTRPSRRTTTAVSAGAAALLFALAGCSSANGEAAPLPRPSDTPATTATASPTASPTPSPTAQVPVTPEEQAVAQAEEAVRRYYAVMDELGIDPAADENKVKEVTITTGQVDAYNRVAFDRGRGTRQVGVTKIAGMTSRLVTLQNEPQKQPPTVPAVDIDVCYDVSGVDVVDATGSSVVRADRRSRALERVTVANYDWPNPASWKVASSDLRGDPCDPAVT